MRTYRARDTMVPVTVGLFVFAALTLMWVATPARGQSFSCNMVLGFSQTNQWYTEGTFEAALGTDTWELVWDGGASIDHFVDPNDPVWASTRVSPCVSNSNTPDRVVLNISGDYSTDVEGWATRITAAIDNIHIKFPGVQQIILMPVVGGPVGYSQCTNPATDEIVRASFNAPYIAQAITLLINANILDGPHPEVATCDDYADDIGHLENSAFGYVATYISNWFLGGPPPPTPTPTSSVPTNTPTPTSPPTNTPTATPTPPTPPTATPTPSPAFVRRFDAGASAPYTDVNGDVWAADVAWVPGGCGYVAGSPFASYIGIAGTTDDLLYQTTRIDLGAFEYRCDVPNGTYRINLDFAELVPNNYVAGNRVFDVLTEGTLALDDFDVFAVAGATTAYRRTLLTEVSDGQLNVLFSAVVGRAMVATIEFSNTTLATPTPTATPSPTRTPTVTPTPSPTPGDTPTPVPCRVQVSLVEGPFNPKTVDPASAVGLVLCT